MRRMAHFALLIFLSVLFAGNVNAQTSGIRGEVSNKGSEYNGNVKVVLRTAKTKAKIRSTKTSLHGNFQFPNLFSGRYELEFISEWSKEKTTIIDVYLEKITLLKIDLEEAPITCEFRIACPNPVVDPSRTNMGMTFDQE